MELKCSDCGGIRFDARLEVGVLGQAIILCCLRCARYISFIAPEFRREHYEVSSLIGKEGK